MEMTIANRLRFEIARCGLSLGEVSRRTGIDIAQVSRFLHGKGSVGLDNAQALADLFDLVLVPRSELASGKREARQCARKTRKRAQRKA